MNRAAIERMVTEKRLLRLARPAFDQVDRLLASASKDVGNVRRFLEIDENRAFGVAYDVIFKTALALMRAHSYRPAASLQHKTTLEFCEAVLDKSWRDALDYFDDMRQKRNRLTYEGDVIVGRAEVEAALAEATRFHTALVPMIEAMRPRRTP